MLSTKFRASPTCGRGRPRSQQEVECSFFSFASSALIRGWTALSEIQEHLFKRCSLRCEFHNVNIVCN